MRLHTLSLTAVGPFAEKQEIDFDRLGSGGLFLFEGPTGVGKSTILDALAFALYGGLASETGDAARMRSDFVDPSVRPVVALEFSVRGERHRVTRSPEFRRPKRRGVGTTVEKASVHLERLEGGTWVSRSTSKEEVGSLITDLVGLNRQQFRQVVLLPQGEFASFLRADDDARRELLVKLFGTQFFRRVTDALQGLAQAARAGVQQAETDLAARVAAAWEASGRVPGAGASAGEATLAAQVEQLDGHAADVVAEAEAAAERAEAALALEVEGRRAVDAAQGLLERVHRRSALLSDLAAAETERPVREEQRARVRAARRAAPVRPLLELAATAAQRVDVARCRAAEAGVPGDEVRAEVAVLQRCAAAGAARAELLRAEAGRLAPAADQESGLSQRRAALAQERAALAEAEGRLAALEARREQLPAALAEVRAQEADARDRAGAVPLLEARTEVLASRRAAAGRAATVAAELPGLRAAQRASRRAFDESRESVELLVERRLRDVRGLLAARLVSGDPCAVCGSTEHPQPAAPDATGVSEEDVRAAAALRDGAELARDEADRAVALAEVALESALDAAGRSSVAELTELLAGAERDLGAARGAQAQVEDLAAQRAALEDELGRSTAEVVPLGQAVALLADSVGRGAEELAATEASVLSARGTAPSVAARIDELTAEAAAEQVRAERLAALAVAVEGLRDAGARVAAEAAAAGFDSAVEAEAAALAPAELSALEDGVAGWQARIDAASAQLASEDLREVSEVVPADAEAEVSRLRAVLTHRAEVSADAQRQATLAAERRARFDARLAEVRDCARDHVAALAQADEVIALDQYARGMAGTPRMTLVTYVLRYWFEQVVQAANVRLEVMSAGKYQLVRGDRAARRDSRVGLGLSVLDRHTGCERSPGTLSGGETFYTSLALALGLADVVVAQAGGAQLDTLFIDEGFGSLDQDTLDDVMGVIDELRGNGRVVGIVSHVPDLKERIAERLSVRRSRPDGPSRVEVHA